MYPVGGALHAPTCALHLWPDKYEWHWLAQFIDRLTEFLHNLDR